MHVADVHVESAYIKPGKQKSALLRDESVQRFADIVNEAKKQKVDVMLICGDLFDRTVVRKSTIKFVLSQIAQNKNIRFFYCLGNHDHKLLFDGEIPKNLTIFPTNFEKYDLGEVVVGGNSVRKYSRAEFAKQVDFDENKINIFMLHAFLASANVDDCLCFDVKDLKNKNINYLALGHVHENLNGRIDNRGEWVYSGNSGGYGFDWNAFGYVLLQVQNGVLSWQRKLLPTKRRFLSYEVDISSCQNFVEIENDEMIKTCSCIKPRSYQLFSHDKFAILIIKSDRAQQAIVFDSANANISRLQADKIEFKDGELVCENANLQQRHLITSEGFIQNNNLQPSPRNAKTLCATFLQLLKEKQYSRANNLVCENLNSNQEKLAEYFGEFQNFFALDETKFVIIKKSGHNVVTFGLKDDKICDIQMD